MFTVLTIIGFLIALLIIGWVIWFLFEFIRYVASGEYEIDKRLREIRK
jgi:hypothetical protein